MEFVDLLLNILSSGLPCCLLALGIFLTYRLLDFADLTAEGSFLISSALVATMIYNGINPWLATLCGFLAGCLCGVVTGLLNRALKIPKLLSGIITMTASGSIAMVIMGLASGSVSPFRAEVTFGGFITKGSAQQTIYSLFYPWQDAGGGIYIVPSPWGDVIKIAVMAVVVVLAILVVYFFFGTQYGMAIRATGMNERMAKAQRRDCQRPHWFSGRLICPRSQNGFYHLGDRIPRRRACFDHHRGSDIREKELQKLAHFRFSWRDHLLHHRQCRDAHWLAYPAKEPALCDSCLHRALHPFVQAMDCQGQSQKAK